MIVERRQADIAVDDRIALVREGAEQIVVELTRIGGVEAEDQARSNDRLDLADEAVRRALGRLRPAQPEQIDRPSRDIETSEERGVGTEGDRTRRSGWWRYLEKKKKKE